MFYYSEVREDVKQKAGIATIAWCLSKLEIQNGWHIWRKSVPRVAENRHICARKTFGTFSKIAENHWHISFGW